MSSFLVETALDTLNEWYRILRPSQFWSSRDIALDQLAPARQHSTDRIQILIANTLLLALAQIPKLWVKLLSWLTFRDHERAEYLADGLTAKVAGVEAMFGLF